MPKPQATRDKYLNNNKDFLNNAADMFAQLKSVYGPNGKMPTGIGYDGTKYNNMPLNVPEGLSENLVTALVVSCCMDPKRLHGEMTTSSPAGDLTMSNQTHIIDNVPKGDNRDMNFGPVLEAGRAEAQRALDAYSKGNPSLLKEKLQHLVDFAVKESVLDVAKPNNITNIESQRTAYLLAQEVIDNKELGIEPSNATSAQKARLKAFPEAMQANADSKAQQNYLAENFDQLSQEQKEDLTAEMLFNAYVATIPNNETTFQSRQTSEATFDLFENMGIDTSGLELDLGQNIAHFADPTKIMIGNEINKGKISDHAAILSQPGGREQLKKLYMDEIRQSDTFKKIAGAKTKEDCLDSIIDSENRIIAHGFNAFNVKPPEAGKEIAGKELDSETNRKIKELQDNMLGKAFAEGGPLNKYNKEYAVEEWSQEAFQKNARVFDAIYNGLQNAKSSGNKSLSPIQSSEDPEYDEIIELAGEMKYESDMILEQGTISQTTLLPNKLDKFSNAVGKYLKTHENDEIDPEKLKTLKQANLMANTVRTSVKEVMSEKKKELEDQFELVDEKAFEDYRVANHDTFFGEKYKDPATRSKSKFGFSTDRSAAPSISIYALATKGYSMDDLLDPEKLKWEKQQMCDEIFKRCQRGTPEDKMQIATYLHDGQKYMDDWTNKQVDKIDFSDPNFGMTPEFAKLRQGMIAGFDCSQERKNCSKEIGELASKATGGKITTKDQFEIAHNQGPAAALIQNYEIMKQRAAAQIMNANLSESFSLALAAKMSINYTVSEMAKRQQTTPQKPYLESFDNNQSINMLSSYAMSNELVKGSEIFKYLKKNPQDIERFTKGFITGKFSDITVSPDPKNGFKLENFPTVAEAKVLCNDNDKMVSAAIKNAKDAKKGVWGGGNDFDDAIKAMEDLEEAQKRIAEMKDDLSEEDRRNQIEDAREQARFAQEKIDIYLERKEKEHKENPQKAVDAKTQKRIDAMKASKMAVREQQYDLDDKIIEMDRKLVEETNKQYAGEMSQKATAPAAEADAPAKDQTVPEAPPTIGEQRSRFDRYYGLSGEGNVSSMDPKETLLESVAYQDLLMKHGENAQFDPAEYEKAKEDIKGSRLYNEMVDKLDEKQISDYTKAPDGFAEIYNKKIKERHPSFVPQHTGVAVEGDTPFTIAEVRDSYFAGVNTEDLSVERQTRVDNMLNSVTFQHLAMKTAGGENGIFDGNRFWAERGKIKEDPLFHGMLASLHDEAISHFTREPKGFIDQYNKNVRLERKQAAAQAKDDQSMTMGEFREWTKNSNGVINESSELDIQSLRNILHQNMVANNLVVRYGADKPLNAADVQAENKFLSDMKPYADTLNSLSKEQLISCINEPAQFINAVNEQLTVQKAQKEQEAPGAEQEGANIEREAVISAQNDSVEKATSEVAGPEPEPMDRVTRVELEDKLAEQTDLLMWDQLDVLKNAYNPKLPGKSGLPEGEDEKAYFESSKDELSDFASKTLAAQLIGKNLKTWQNSVLGKASEEQIKQMNEKSLSNDNILENARLLQESPAFKQMIAGVKTWDDFDKFRDLTNTNYGKQLINELSKNSKQIEKQEEVKEAAAAQKTLNAPQKQNVVLS